MDKTDSTRRGSRFKHGLSKSPEYTTWRAMLSRCRRVTSDCYKNYGGRGIAVSDEWKSFEAFYRDMGPKPFPEATIERIENSLGYSKDNCEWATRATQLRNTRRNRVITFNGITQCLTDWATQLGMNFRTLANRLDRGWPIEKALTSHRVESKDSRGARKITFQGKTLCLAEWARTIGICKATLLERLENWTIEKALTTPPNATRKRSP